jgi:hypothetical protein
MYTVSVVQDVQVRVGMHYLFAISKKRDCSRTFRKLIVKNIEVISDHPYALASALADMNDYSKNREALVRKRPGGGRRSALVRPARSR